MALTSNTAGPPSASSIIRRKVRGHSRIVHVLRWLLPVLILAMLGVLAAYVVDEAVRSAAARPKESPTQIKMINPHFVGHDDQGRSFALSARQAARDDAHMQLVLLTAPVMVMDEGASRPKTVTSDRGVFDENTRLMRLIGHVRVDDSAASTLATDEALVDTKAGTVSGVTGIAAASPTATIEAGRYTASEKGGHVTLTGGVHAVLKGR